MFGFDAKKAREEYEARQNDGYSGRKNTIKYCIAQTFGSCDPQEVNKILWEFMPEMTGTIIRTEERVIQNGKNQAVINDNINMMHDELVKELKSLRLQNQELQEKYNALVERMASVLERESGKGR